MLKTNKNTIILNEILGIIKSKNIPTIQLTNAVDFNFDGLDFNTLWPSTNLDVYNFSDFNDTSISFLISYKNFDLLTMGDLSSEYEEKAIKDINNLTDIDLEVLKASHHGSKHSSSLKLLNILTPEIIVFSAGRNNSYSHPNPEVIENSNKIGSDVYRTDISGNIKFVINSSEDYKIFKQH
jgi:competence protein ComEC